MFRKEVLEKKSDGEFGEIIVLPKNSIYVSCVFLTAIVLCAVVFISFNEYEKKEIVKGYVMPDKGVVKIFAPREGYIKELKVTEGQHIKKGQILALVQSQLSDVDGELQSEVQLDEFLNQLEYLNQELANHKLNIASENRKLNLVNSGILAEISILETQLTIELEKLKVAKDEYSTIQDIGDKDYLTRAEINRSRQVKLSIETAAEQIKLQLVRQKNTFNENSLAIEQLANISKENLLNHEKKRSLLSQQISQAKSNGLYAIQSPIDGVVSSRQVSEGSGIAANIPLMSILHEESTMMVKLAVSSRSIGFIRIGQNVRIKYDAFPYQRYGSYMGVVEKITQSGLTDIELAQAIGISGSSGVGNEVTYLVNVSLSVSEILANGRKISLQPGMSLSAAIITDKQSLLQWLLEPLYTVTGRTS